MLANVVEHRLQHELGFIPIPLRELWSLCQDSERNADDENSERHCGDSLKRLHTILRAAKASYSV